jgi:hypothetical protein
MLLQVRKHLYCTVVILKPGFLTKTGSGHKQPRDGQSRHGGVFLQVATMMSAVGVKRGALALWWHPLRFRAI